MISSRILLECASRDDDPVFKRFNHEPDINELIGVKPKIRVVKNGLDLKRARRTVHQVIDAGELAFAQTDLSVAIKRIDDDP